MAHEILSAKLHELDERVARLHSRVLISEGENLSTLRQEEEALRRECAQDEMTLRNRLCHSRSQAASDIAASFSRMDGMLSQARENALSQPSSEQALLLAEYALDFAMQAASRALLISLEAIDAQQHQQRSRERHEQLGDIKKNLVDRAAVIARNAAEHDADQTGARSADKSNEDRDTPSVQKPCQNIAAHAIRAEQMLARNGQRLLRHVHQRRIIRRQQRRSQRHQNDDRHERAARDRHFVRAEFL